MRSANRPSRTILCAFAAGVLLCACAPPRPLSPPLAPVVPRELRMHGDVRVDNYYWLRERGNPAVLAYLRAENEHTRAAMQHTDELQRALYAELKGRIQETDQSVPMRIDERYYYTRTVEGQQYRIHCRRTGSLGAPEEVLLDENALARGSAFFALGGFDVSPDHNVLAYAEDRTGGESFTVRFKDLRTGRLLPDRLPGAYYGAAWASDSRTFFYTVHDAAKRPFKVLRHRLGTPTDQDAPVLHETDEAFHLYLWRSRSREYIFIKSASNVTDEIRFVPAGDPDRAPTMVQPREHRLQYAIDHHGGRFFIVTNDRAVNFKLVEAPVEAPGRAGWREVIPYDPEVKVESVDAFRDHLALLERHRGLTRIRIIPLAGGASHHVSFSEPVYTCGLGDNPAFATGVLRLRYTSLTTPPSVIDYDMRTRQRWLKKEQPVRGGYDRTRYRTERVFARAPDGKQVPISLVYRRGLPRDGRNPALLTGYGAYGISYDPEFEPERVSLLDRGFVVGIAHVRGGGDLGRPWYEDGKLLRKKNTFTDFIAAAEHLVAQRFTAADRLAITGISAGGLLMGAVTNLRPQLFHAVVAEVPFVDALTTMLDPSIPLTVIEYEEWGNPNQPELYRHIKSYAPYDNVERKAYPHLLITAGLNDPRVPYWEPAKWAAKLRALKRDDHLLLLKTELGAGHAGPSGRYNRLREVAFQYAFILDRLGIAR